MMQSAKQIKGFDVVGGGGFAVGFVVAGGFGVGFIVGLVVAGGGLAVVAAEIFVCVKMLSTFRTKN